MALAKINGRTHFLNCDEIRIVPVSNGRWTVEFDGRSFVVVGGIHSGGARDEWFCYSPEMYGEAWLPCRSMVAAVKLGVVY